MKSVAQSFEATSVPSAPRDVKNVSAPFEWRLPVIGLWVFAGYYIGAKIGFALTFAPYSVSVLWPPNSILVAALLLTPPRIWWFVLLAAFPAHCAAELQSHVPPLMILCWFISNASEALIGAGLTRYLVGGPFRFTSLRNAAIFCLSAVFAGPFLSSFLDAAFVRWNAWGQGAYWEIWRVRVTSNVLAALTVAPLIVTWATSGFASLRRAKQSRYLEAGLLFLGLLAVSFAVLYELGPGTDSGLLYLVLPFLLWAAVQFGSCGASTALAIVTFSAIWAATHGHGPFAGGSPEQNALAIQVFLIVLSVPLIFLAAVVEERASVEQRFTKVFRSSPDAMFVVRRRDSYIIDVNEHWQTIFGYPREEAINHTISHLNLNIRERDLEKLIASTSEGEPLRDVEMSLRTKTGDLRETVLSADSVDIAGEPCFVVIIRDITNRKRREAALLESEAELRETQRRMDLAAKAADLGIWVWDIVRDEIWASEKERALFGFAPSEKADIDRFRNAIHPDDRAWMRKALENSLSAGTEYEAEHRVLLPNGQIRWLATRGRIEFGGDGNPAQMRGVSFDVTRRKLGELALSESESRFRVVANAAPVLIWMSGLDKLCTFFNEPWLKFTGRTLEQELGSGWVEGVHPDDLQRCVKTYTEAFDLRRPFVMQYRLRRHDGEYRWISDHGVPRYNSKGNFSGYIGSCVDVTDLIRKEEALREFEERVVLAAEATHHGVWELDIATKELWMSDKARALFEFDPHARLKQQMLRDRIHPEDRLLWSSAVEHAIETQGEYSIEYRALLPGGALRWISGRGRCMPRRHGKGKRLICVSVDITSQKQAQDLFRLAAEGSHLGVWYWDEAAQTLSWDRATQNMFGVSPDSNITIDTFYGALHPGDAERVKQTWRQALELQLPYQIEFRTQRPDGTICWIHARGRGYYDELGKPLSMTGVVFDITDRKEAELAAQRNREDLSHLSRVAAMGEMAASIAHELNQPLSGIISNASAGKRFIDRGNVDLGELRDLLADIVADGSRAGDVIRGIQDMVKKGSRDSQPVNLNDVVMNVVHMVRPNAMLHSCELGTFIDPNLATVEGDPVQLQQVLLNLVINAFDAMRDMPLNRRKVIIATERNANGATRVSVRDYGVGIPEEAREKLFDHFFTTKREGLGMGLAIVRSIVESHAGTIVAENADGGGARFQFTIPADRGKVSQ